MAVCEKCLSKYQSDLEKYIEENNLCDQDEIEILVNGWNIAMKSILRHNEKRHIYINQNTVKRIKQWMISEVETR